MRRGLTEGRIVDRRLVVGTATFAVASVMFGVACDIVLEAAGLRSAAAGHVATSAIAVPLALLTARRFGRLTRPALLLASAVVAVAVLSAIVVLLDAVAVPAGGRVQWRMLFDPPHGRSTALGVAVLLLAPQLWWTLFERTVGTGGPSNPTPVRGVASWRRAGP